LSFVTLIIYITCQFLIVEVQQLSPNSFYWTASTKVDLPLFNLSTFM
jgi:hypothetical protein